MEHIYSIYKATCLVNNKSYIGFTQNFERRKRKHIQVSFNNKDPEHKRIFHNAIRKYEPENFEWSILYQSDDSFHTLNIMEPLYILIYDSYLNGYNMTTGGEGSLNHKHSKSSIEKIGLASRGRKQSEESKHKKSIQKLGIKNPMYGKGHLRKGNLNPMSKTFSFYKGKEIIQTDNIKQYCLDNNLTYNTMLKIGNGLYPTKLDNYKGYKPILIN